MIDQTSGSAFYPKLATEGGPWEAKMELYRQVKLIIQGKTMMLPTKEHLLALYELFHFAAQECILLEERLNDMERTRAINTHNPNSD